METHKQAHTHIPRHTQMKLKSFLVWPCVAWDPQLVQHRQRVLCKGQGGRGSRQRGTGRTETEVGAFSAPASEPPTSPPLSCHHVDEATGWWMDVRHSGASIDAISVKWQSLFFYFLLNLTPFPARLCYAAVAGVSCQCCWSFWFFIMVSFEARWKNNLKVAVR